MVEIDDAMRCDANIMMMQSEVLVVERISLCWNLIGDCAQSNAMRSCPLFSLSLSVCFFAALTHTQRGVQLHPLFLTPLFPNLNFQTLDHLCHPTLASSIATINHSAPRYPLLTTTIALLPPQSDHQPNHGSR